MIPAILLGVVVWHYDQEIRAFVKKHAGHRIEKIETRAIKIYEKARAKIVSKDINSKEQ